MQFLSRVFGAAPKASQVRQADRSPRSRCSQISVESLEGRNLMSGITNYAGACVITATQANNNTAMVTKDQSGNLVVSLNNETQTFSAGTIWTICYKGALGGGDKFTNNTDLSDSVQVYGANNTVQGGSNWGLFYVFGNNNTCNTGGGPGYVFDYGSNDQINANPNVTVNHYDFNGWW